MSTLSRRGLFGSLFGAMGAGFVSGGGSALHAATEQIPLKTARRSGEWTRHEVMEEMLFREIDCRETYDAWFGSMKSESYSGGVLVVSVPVGFVKNWIKHYYQNELFSAARSAYGGGLARVDVVVRRYDRQPRSERVIT